MRFALGMILFLSATGVVACSSSSSPAVQAEAGPTACSSNLSDLINNAASLDCPNDGNGNQLSYDMAIEATCATFKLKKGDIEYGQCFEYLVYRVDIDTSGHNFSECFYDVTTHAFVGAIYADGSQDQCGGSSFTVAGGNTDPTCQISGFNGGGAAFESCTPVVDGGAETSLLGM